MSLIDLDALSPLERAKLSAQLRRHVLAGQEHVYAYAIQAGTDGPVKIGLAKKPAERLKTLQTANAEELHGLAAWRVIPVEERILHAHFAGDRIRGEWFRPTPELIEHVRDLGGDWIDW